MTKWIIRDIDQSMSKPFEVCLTSFHPVTGEPTEEALQVGASLAAPMADCRQYARRAETATRADGKRRRIRIIQRLYDETFDRRPSVRRRNGPSPDRRRFRA